MFYLLSVYLIAKLSFLNVFKYITVRSVCAIFTSFFISLCFTEKFIKWMRIKHQKGQPIRDYGPESHIKTKQGTPTMGGLFIIFSTLFSTFFWADLSNILVIILIASVILFGALGFADDYLKLTKRNTEGVSFRSKLFWQFTFAFILSLSIFFYHSEYTNVASVLTFPFLKNFTLNLGIFYVIFAMFVIVGSSNATNLTDGLDGLATVPIIIAIGCFSLIAYLSGNVTFTHYLLINYVPGASEISVVGAAIIGSCLGFLWYNAPPARLFMGDVGSLALGAAIGTISIIVKHEIVLVIIGGLFVIEAISVILQVGSFKLRGKRIFKMAPIHHHFEKIGWSESTIVIRFWIIAFLFALLGLSTLKLR